MASLYLFPTLLSDVDWQECLPKNSIEKILSCDCFIVEELRTARRFLRKIGYLSSFDHSTFFVLNEHTTNMEMMDYLLPLNEGRDIFLMSEAGLPCVADPGSKIVAIAQQQNIHIVPLTGPSSIYMSLMASGFNGQNFAFLGYLPVKDSDRDKRLRQIEERCYKDNQTQIFIETPYRNDKMLQSILKILSDATLLCIATDITSSSQSIITKSVAKWKIEKDFIIGKKNTIFLIYK
ncbi:MAG: SAM-dependent methyltransferase [Bacteroidales bacterium]